MNKHLALFVGAFMLFVSSEATMASSFLATFSGSQWKDTFSPATRTEAIAGSLVYSGPDRDTVTSIEQISLTIHGHQYAAADVASDVINGLLEFGDTDPIGTLFPLSSDHFYVVYLNGSLVGFNYTAPDTPSSRWGAFDVSGSISAIPLPAGLPLYVSGVAVLGLLSRRRQRKSTTP
jgi:hypothetical protein